MAKLIINNIHTDYLNECFSYSAEEGTLRWKARPRHHFKGGAGWHNFNNQFAGGLAGATKPDGRLEVKLDGRTFKLAHIVWRMDGRKVQELLDHIDGDPSNNRLSNLREANAAQNARNRSSVAANSSGVRGVTKHISGKWWARITYEGRTRSLGLYASVDAAADVVRKYKKQLFGEFARA